MQIPSEDFLHFIWKTKSFNLENLRTTSGEKIQIIKFGIHNHNAGPDFLNGHIKIGEQLWHGNIEIHIKASDWQKHKHEENPNYDSVILHVVFKEDKQIYNSKNQAIPTFELERRIPETTLKTYAKLQASKTKEWIPCQSLIANVPDLKKTIFQERLLVERLEAKTAFTEKIFEEEKGDWYMVFIRMLLVAFGTKVNKEASVILGERLNKRILMQCSHELRELEAYIFGLAGFLENAEDEYSKELFRRFSFLKSKYKLQSLPGELWKYSRMRPQNFPTIRLAQVCAMLCQQKDILSTILDLDQEMEPNSFLNVELSSYWDTHYKFGTTSKKTVKKISKGMQDLVGINCFAPFLFLYGQMHDEQRYKDQAIELLGKLKAEKNAITKQWERLGMVNKTAQNSQALIHLKNNYCSNMKCLSCDIGYALLKPL